MRYVIGFLAVAALASCGDDRMAPIGGGAVVIVEPDVERRSLGFGALLIGDAKALALEIRNEGDRTAAFHVGGFGPPFDCVTEGLEVAPGASGKLWCIFSPRALGPWIGRAILRLGQRTIDVALTGSGVPPGDGSCLVPSPDPADFGPSCELARMELGIANHCEVPVFLDSAEIEGPFALSSQPELPWRIDPGASVAFELGRTAGGHDRGQLLLGVRGSAPRSILLAGRPGASEKLTDEIANPALPAYDLLLVVDDSPAMREQREVLEQKLGSLAAILSVRDFRIAVTTTAVEPVEGCDVPAGQLLPVDESGALFVTNDFEDPAGALLAAVERTACVDRAPGQGLEAARIALASEPGFRRPDTDLKLAIVAAEDDASPGALDEYAAWFEDAGVTWLDAIVPAGACAAPVETRYEQLAGLYRTGRVVPWCDDEWFEYMPAPFPTGFYLARLPVDLNADGAICDVDCDGDGAPDRELLLTVDGEPFPSAGENGSRRWTYGARSNALHFESLAIPEPGAKVEAVYNALVCE